MRPFWLRFVVFLGFLGLSAVGSAAETPIDRVPADVPLLSPRVRLLMQDRNYAEARTAIDEEAKAKDAPHDYLNYLKGWSFYLEKQYEAATAALGEFEKQFPQSPWLRRARFAKAMALARKGDARAAEVIFRAEAEYLLSADRKQQLAGIYLEFADAHFRPAKRDQKPDYAKALQFYQKALEMGPKPDKRAEVELLVAQCHQQTDNNAEAAKAYAAFIAAHPNHALEIEARYRLGQCRLAEGNLREARRVWQDLLAKFNDTKSERVADAAFHLAKTWRIPEPKTREELTLGVAALTAFIERFPTHKLASLAHLEIAKSYVHRGRHEDAVACLGRFIEDQRYKDRKEVSDAYNLLGQSYQLQKKFTEALAVWREYLVKFPAQEAWTSVQKEIVDTEYLMGLEQYKAKDYQAAARLLAEFLSKYPLDSRAPGILFLFGQMNHQQRKWDAAIADWRRLTSKYPRTEEASHAQFMIARTTEEELGNLEEALEEYRKVASGRHADDARQAIQRLTSKSMTVASDRAFRTDETPTLKLTTRNIDAVTVRSYTVDLETYFRKMHTADGVERLNIALIEPDATSELKVPGYARYQQIQSPIQVPLPAKAKAGVMAVTVSSPTLEATTLVIQSDLEIVVKSSRDEVFVFAQNMRTGKPWPGVRLLLSNGSQVFADQRTGESGVFQKAFRELQKTGNVRVFAMAEGHVASNVVDLEGVKPGRGLTDKGYIYTDCPVYQAGQSVHVRGCLRQVAGDQYTIEKDKRYTVEVFDGRNRMVWQGQAALSAFGTFEAHFVLPPTSPQGQYRILARDDAGHNYQGSFQVLRYQQDTIRLVIDTPPKVYCRGDVIEGTIRATYYYGAPLVGREIRYQLSQEPVVSAKTDAKGEVRFRLATRQFSESQVLPLVATLAEHALQATRHFVLAAEGFSLELSTVRPVFVAGETFELSVKTLDPETKPVARQLTLKVLELVPVQGKVGERLVEQHPLATAADGTARHTLKLAKGGAYMLRAEGTDRFDNLISGQLQVQVSDDQDRQRVLILADRHTYRAGDTAQIQVHWREAPALALVTFQAARILDYRLVELKTGANKLAVPMTPNLAPNFDLSVSVMTDARDHLGDRPNFLEEKMGLSPSKKEPAPDRALRPVVRFHETTSPFAVERDLQVKIACKRKAGGQGPVRPGDAVEVAVSTADPQGKPVAAEVSLALIRQSLLDNFAGQAVPIQEFFHGTAREPAIRTSSSITLAHHPITRPIHPRLLAERQRRQIAEEEDASRREGLAAHTGDGAPPPADEGYGPPPHATGSADFDSLVRLITSTIEPETWDNVGLPGKIRGFATNLGIGKGTKSARSLAGFGGVTEGITEIEDPFAQEPADKTPGTSPATPRSPLAAADAGYWNPAIVTGADGKATVTFMMPEESTAWKLLAKGITAETLVGEAAEPLTVRKALFGELKIPAALTHGDQAEVGVVLHNDAIDKGPIDVTLKTTVGARSVEQKKTISATAKGLHELSFKATMELPGHAAEQGRDKAAKPDAKSPAPNRLAQGEGTAVFELAVAGGPHRDVVRRAVPLLPYGMPVFAAASGSATGDATAWVEPPKDMRLLSPSLQIVIGPTVEQSLLDILAPPALGCQGSGVVASEVETAASDLMASLALQKLLGTSRQSGAPQAQALDGRIRASLGLLVLAQQDDGGWGWTGAAKSNRHTSAYVAWAITLARKAGYPVADDAFHKALDYLREQFSATENTDYQGKAVLLHALTMAGEDYFALANHLYRERTSLGPAGLACLAMALAQMDRKPMAVEILDLLGKHPALIFNQSDLAAGAAGRLIAAGSGKPSYDESTVEVRALWALALQQAAPKSPHLKEQVDWLLANRVGQRWAPDKATGPAAMALCTWFGENRFQGGHYKLAVRVNGRQVEVLDVDAAAGVRVIAAAPSLLVEGKQRVEFQLTGRGRYAYQCVLAGFVPADKLKSTSTDWEVERTSQPALQEFDGRVIPRGFGIVARKAAEFRNPMTQLPVGRRGLVELKLHRKEAAPDAPATPHDYLVVTEPIPCGAAVIESSLHGAFDRAEILPGAIVFYIGSDRPIGPITYRLDGYVPGTYRASPTVVRNAYRPEQMAVSRPASLVVLPLGAATADKYRLSPEELLALGKRLKDKGDRKAAAAHLAELVEQWALKAEVYHETIQMLLDISMELGPAAKVVKYFEILKEKWPNENFSFDKALKVAAAYHDIGEFERSYLAYREIVESTFTHESGVAGFLESQEEFLRSVDVMGRLLRDYPPEPYVAEAEFALAQRVYAKAPEAADDARLRQQRVNRVVLIRRAWRMLEGLLTAWPDDPAADQAAFAAANALLELKEYKEAAAAADRYARCYPKSDLLDSYWYLIAYCDFATAQHQAALEMCRKVADTKRPDPKTGRMVDSPNKWRAIYILGQVYHSLGQFADAIREYRRVEDRFPDAKFSIAWFLRKAIELPEVTTVKPGTPAEIDLKFSNIAACDVKVYRIDLMKFSLLAGNLGGITQINLAGIRPLHDAAEKLGEGADYRARTRKLSLPLAKEGAYLVVCRGEDLHASGLVLVTPLVVEVQSDPRSGQVRAMVKDVTTDRYVTGVQVKVIGSRNEDFVSGTTDLRGVFVADGIQGAPTVIAQGEAGRCAFFRSPLLPTTAPAGGLAQRPEPGRPPEPTADDPFAAKKSDERPIARAKPTASPDHRPGKLLAPKTKPDLVALSAADLDETNQAVKGALNAPTQMEFIDTPLADVVAYLKDYHHIEIQLDKKALDDSGVATDTPVTKNLKDVTLKSALRVMLRELNLTYVTQDGVLLITTPEEAESRLTTKVYPVEDLVLVPGESKDEVLADFDSLIEVITSTVGPTTWDEVGGPGSVQPFPNKLAIILSQTEEVHEEVEDLLRMLRRVGKDAVVKKMIDRPAGSTETSQKHTEISAAGGQASPRRRAAAGFGGLGGYGGFGPPDELTSQVISVMPVEGVDLLEGLQSTNRALQTQKVKVLKKRQESGSTVIPSVDGVGGGGFF